MPAGDPLTARCGRGDGAAVAEFVRRFAPVVRSRLRCVHHVAPCDREDVELDVLWAAVRQLRDGRHRFQDMAHFLGWLRAITAAKAADYWRRRFRRDAVTSRTVSDLARSVAPIPGDQEAAVLWNEWLAALPPRHRHVFVLHFVRGRSPAAIARDLGISPPRARALLAEAKGLVRRAAGVAHTSPGLRRAGRVSSGGRRGAARQPEYA